MCGRLQRQFDQKLYRSWTLKHQSIPTMHFKGPQPQPKWVHQHLPNRRCNTETGSGSIPRIHHLWWKHINPQNSPKLSTTRQTKLQGQRLLPRCSRPSFRGGPATKAWPQRDTRNNSEHTCPNCASDPHRSREECPTIDQECYHCGKTGHFLKACRRNPNNRNKSMVNHIQKDKQFVDSRQQPLDQIQSECVYTHPYLTGNKRAPVNYLRPTTKIHYMCHSDTEHIRLLWVSQAQKSWVYPTECEVDTGAGCNILPVCVTQELFSQEWLGALDPPRVHIKAYGGQAVHILCSCILYLHIDIKMFPTIFKVTNKAGPIILGRRHVKAMGYINFPKIR